MGAAFFIIQGVKKHPKANMRYAGAFFMQQSIADEKVNLSAGFSYHIKTPKNDKFREVMLNGRFFYGIFALYIFCKMPTKGVLLKNSKEGK